MPFTAKTPNSAYAWRPDLTTFHAADVVPDALINVFSTVSGVIEGDEPSVRVAFIDDDETTLLVSGVDREP